MLQDTTQHVYLTDFDSLESPPILSHLDKTIAIAAC
jgi:hypothetical protein